MSNNEKIELLLANIESKENVKIVFASEVGSRMCGLESINSDYDIGFIFVHNDKKKYISIVNPKDNLEGKIGEYEWKGWDITKALRLASKMNISITEWIFSPIHYRKDLAFVHSLQELMIKQKKYHILLHHYSSIAKTIYNTHIVKSEQVRAKKYLQTLKSVIVYIWLSNKIITEKENQYIIKGIFTFYKLTFLDLLENTMADDKLDMFINPNELYKDIEILISLKNKDNNATTSRVKSIDNFIDRVFKESKRINTQVEAIWNEDDRANLQQNISDYDNLMHLVLKLF